MRKSILAAIWVAALGAAVNGTAGVWVDDALPASAGTGSTGGETWNWVSSNPSPYSGSVAHQSLNAVGLHGHSFNWASATLTVNTGDTLYTYVYLDPANPPTEIMLSWCTTAGSWEHRAYWGADVINYGTDGTAGRMAMGPLPPTGQWVRLEVPASAVGLEGQTLQGMDFAVFNGHVTWDYAGTAAAGTSGSTTGSGTTGGGTTTTNTPSSGTNQTGTVSVWMDDALPAGAGTGSTGGETWNWVSSNPAPYSGALSHQSLNAVGLHGHSFNWASATLNVNTGDTLIAYVYLDPANPPSEIMLSWCTASGSWEHRAYWGANMINYGADGTASRHSMGALPPAGQWAGLQVPASAVGLEGQTLQGMDFAVFSGRATWDYAGKATAGSGSSGTTTNAPSGGTTTNAPTGTTNQTGTASVWMDDALPAGAGTGSTSGETWNWLASNPSPYSGSLSHQSVNAAGLHDHSFNWASTTLSVSTGDTLFTYVYLDPANPPSEIMLSWCTTSGSWEHRAYWGANLISYGTDGTAGRLSMGALPAAGQWVLLSVPASAVGLEGQTLQGMDFAVFNGRATWDYSGKAAGGSTGPAGTTTGGTGTGTGTSTNGTGTVSSTNSPVTGNLTNAVSTNIAEYDALSLPTVGESMLRVLSPTMLELHMINTEPPGGPVSTWGFVNSSGQGQLPSTSQFTVTANGQPLSVQTVGFKRRPLYAPLAQRDLRVDNCLYLQLSAPVADNALVSVANPGGALWSSSVQYTATADPMRYSPVVHVNQEGYVSTWPKKAMVGYFLGSMGEMSIPATSFSVVDATTGVAQFQGTLTLRADVGYSYSPMPYQQVYQADFSSLTTPGQYVLVVPGLGTSMPFRINDGVAMAFARAYELGLYGQRCGTACAMPYTRFTHAACHTEPASVPLPQSSYSFTWNTIANYAMQSNPDNPVQTAPKLTSPANQLFPFVRTGTIDTSGGHHDAGDYSKYTINCASLTHLLMFSADSLAGVADLDNLGIPESADGISDILQEAKWEADYLTKIQDSDGGFFFLVYPQNREYESNVTPDHGDPQVVWPKTTSVTAAAVAALAQCASSPLMKQSYPAAAATYLQKAQLGWQFLTNAINRYGKTGAYQKITHYGDDFADADELAWAACEMFLATGDQGIHQTLKSWFPDPTDPATFRWGWWRLYACYGNALRSYAFAARSGRLPASQLDANYLAKCVTTITNAANDALNWSHQGAYGSSFPQPTKQVQGAGWYFSASQAFDIAVAYQINPNAAYLDAMLANVNYEGGCNPVNASYVTGLGWKRQRQIVDQYSWNDGRTMPRSGIPIASVQQGFVWTSTYGSDLGSLTFPGDSSSPPYPFYDRWADTVNVTTEFVVTDMARGLGTTAFLAAMTSLKTQAWTPVAGQISGLGAQMGQSGSATATFQAPGMDLTDAQIVWESPGQEPAFGPSYVITGSTNATQWVEAEAAWPDGRRVFATTQLAVTNGLPNVSISSSDPTMTAGLTSDTASFTITRTGDLSADLSVALQPSGTATKWNDYRRPQGDMPDTFTIPAGQSSITVTVYAPANSTLTSPLTAILTVLAGAGYNVGTPSSVTLTIQPAGFAGSGSSSPTLSGFAVTKALAGMTVSWATTPGKTYSVSAANDLTSKSWTYLISNVVATGPSLAFLDPAAATATQRFYKVYAAD